MMKNKLTMIKNKKGVFYTLSLTLFALLLLGSAVLFFRQASSAESRQIELSYSQKIQDTDSSIKNVFAEMILREAKINLTSANDSLTISESFPKSFTELDNLISQSAARIETDFSNVNIIYDNYLLTHGIIISPLNVSYQHNGSSKIIISRLDNVTGFNIILSFSQNITSCTSSADEGEGNMNINYLASSAESNCILNANNVEEVTINMTIGETKSSLYFDDDGSEGNEELVLTTNSPVKSNITINFNLNQKINVEVPLMIEIDDQGEKFYKKSNVGIPLLSQN